MADYRVQPKSSGYTGGDGSSWTNALSAVAAASMITAGTIKSGDRVLFGAAGAFGLADAADFPNATWATTAGIPSSQQTGAGILFGTHQGTQSKASGIVFDGAGEGTKAKFYMHGGRTMAERQIYALGFRGEGMVIRNFDVQTPDFNYLASINTSNANPETLSFENLGIAVYGGGNTIENNDIDGNAGPNGFCRYPLFLLLPNDSMGASYGRHLRTIVRGNKVQGGFHNLRIDPGGPGGGGGVLRYGTELQVYDNDLFDACWGRRQGDARLPYTAATHGGGGSISGTFMGKSFFSDNRIWGDCQDGMDLICAGLDVCWNTVRDIHSVNPIAWVYVTSAYVQQVVTGRFGDGIKLGLTGTDGTAPLAWMGTDGTKGGIDNVAEANNRCYGNRVYRVSGVGLTTNDSNGMFIAYNEILDSEAGGILLFAKVGNQFVMNNYVRLANTNVGFAACLDVGTGVRVWEYNNIWNAGPNAAARSAFDANYRFGSANGSRTAKKNVFVTGRRQVFTSGGAAGTVYDGTNDVNSGAAQAVNYVEGQGFPLGDAMQGIADAECLRIARTAGSFRDINKRRIVLPNNVGPYTVPI